MAVLGYLPKLKRGMGPAFGDFYLVTKWIYFTFLSRAEGVPSEYI